MSIGGKVFKGATKFLDSVAVQKATEYSYQPGMGASNTMTAVGLLGRQFLGANRDGPVLTGGAKYLMANPPSEEFPSVYYWYYGTQVMHNMRGENWDTWSRKLRDILVRTQVRNVGALPTEAGIPRRTCGANRAVA